MKTGVRIKMNLVCVYLFETAKSFQYNDTGKENSICMRYSDVSNFDFYSAALHASCNTVLAVINPSVRPPVRLSVYQTHEL